MPRSQWHRRRSNLPDHFKQSKQHYTSGIKNDLFRRLTDDLMGDRDGEPVSGVMNSLFGSFGIKGKSFSSRHPMKGTAPGVPNAPNPRSVARQVLTSNDKYMNYFSYKL